MNKLTVRTYHNSDEAWIIDLWFECGLAVSWNNPKQDIE